MFVTALTHDLLLYYVYYIGPCVCDGLVSGGYRGAARDARREFLLLGKQTILSKHFD